MQSVAILAGGLGTRLRSVTGPDMPKALVPVAGRAFIDWKLEELHSRGVTRVVMLVGHGADALVTHVGNATHGLQVEFLTDGPALLGTGGALRRTLPLLDDPFWVAYGDSLLTVDLAAAERQFSGSPSLALMTVLHNRDAVEASNARVEGTRVKEYSKAPRPDGAEYIDYGMLLLRHGALGDHAPGEAFDLADTLRALSQRDLLDAFTATEPFHDIGTPENLRATEDWLRGTARS